MTDWLLTQSLIGSVLIVLLSGLQRAMPVTFGVGNLYKLWLLLPLSLLLSLLPTLHPPPGAMGYLVTGFHKTQSAISGNAYAQSNLLLWIWAFGAGVIFLKLLLKVQVTSRLLKQGAELDVRRYLPADLSEELHRQRVVTLQSEQINSPCVAGVFQSYLLLPKNLVNQVPPQQLEHIVQHELCHIQRRDVFWNLLVQGYLLIFWFNPLVWWGVRQFRLSQELACDQMVTRGHTQSEKHGYMQTMLACSTREQVTNPMTSYYAETHMLKRRFEGLMQPGPSTFFPVLLASTVFATWVIGINLLDKVSSPTQAVTEVVAIIEAVYPDTAQELGIEGHVDLEFDILANGQVANVNVIDQFPEQLFGQAATEALTQWRYRSPGRDLQGYRVRFEFLLEQDD